MKWSNIKTTIFKELRGIVRDKKSMSTIIYLPLIIPIFILLMGFMFDVLSNSNYTIGVNYELTNEEKEIVKNVGEDLKFKKIDNIDKMKEAYEKKDINAYIIKEDNKYTIYTDKSGNSGEIISMMLGNYLDSYNKYLANQYLTGEGIDLNKVYNNITVEEENLGNDNTNTMVAVLLSMAVTYILMIVVQSCGVVATDATAGEKERGTLETILTFPVKSTEFITGKYLAVTIFGVILGLISLAVTFPSIYVGKMLFESFKDITVNISVISILLLIFIIMISSFLTAGVSMALAGKSKTFKEAQSSLQALSFLPMIPYFAKFLEVDTTIFNLVPIANCGLALNDIIMDSVNVNSLLIIICTTIVYTVLIILFVSKQYKSEKTLFM
jgi:sodium transport system permease protein